MVVIEINTFTGWLIVIGFVIIFLLNFMLVKPWLTSIEVPSKVMTKTIWLCINSGLAFIGLFFIIEIIINIAILS